MGSERKDELHDDRRRFPRLRETCRIRVRRIDGPAAARVESGEKSVEAMTVNISGGGVCFQSDEAYTPGEFLAVELGLPGFRSPVVALARTAYCDGPVPPCEVGVEFWWVGWGDDSAQRQIADYIKSELRPREET